MFQIAWFEAVESFLQITGLLGNARANAQSWSWTEQRACNKSLFKVDISDEVEISAYVEISDEVKIFLPWGKSPVNQKFTIIDGCHFL